MEWSASDVAHHKELIIFHACEAFFFFFLMAFEKINDIVKRDIFNFIKPNC